MKILLHTDAETVHSIEDGRLYSLPPNEAVEIESDFIAEKIVEHKQHHGIVFVTAVKGPAGVIYDIAGAQAEARAALEKADKKMISDYIQAQFEDRIARGVPPLPPQGRIAALAAKYGIDWGKDYNLNIPTVGNRTPVMAPVDDTRLKALEADNQSLKDQLERLLKAMEAGAGTAKTAEPPVDEMADKTGTQGRRR